MPATSIIDRARTALSRQWVLALALLLYLPLVFTGYGSDVDTFRVLEAGRNFLKTADYVPSRRPGYLVYELAIYPLDQLGGSVLANLGSVFWALVAVACFLRICRRHRIPNRELLAVILVLQPVFWYNATVTLDYMWALGMLMAGFDLLEQERFGWAGLALGLAVGCRLSSLVVAVLLVGYAWQCSPEKRLQVFGGGVLAVVLGCLAYVLPWDFAEWRRSFWQLSTGSPELWSRGMQLGRFAYKNLYFWGVPAGLFSIVVLFLSLRNRAAWKSRDRLLLAGLCGLVLAGSEVVFLRFPIEVEYLLPILPFFLLLAGSGLRSRQIWLVFLVLVLSFGFINVEFCSPELPWAGQQRQDGLVD